MIHGNKVLFGWCNCAAFNSNPAGDLEGWCLTRKERNERLAKFRAAMVSRGLSESASRSGIYPVKMRASKVREVCGENVVDALG